MPQISFSTDWLKKFSDPYALLGISVAADDRRVLKRYRNVAKILHPDSYALVDDGTKELASQIFARLVNPAYQKLKQDKGRAETLAMLRFRVRRITREGSLVPQTEIARQLMAAPVQEAEIFYEQAIATLAESQYPTFEQFEAITQQLGELNLVFLRQKMGDPIIREKRTGLVSAAEAKPIQFTPVEPEVVEKPVANYAQRHYERARAYSAKASWSLAVQELRDAIKLEPANSDYHALLGKVYLMQELVGMAKVHFRQALKLNPQNSLALEYAKRLGLELPAQAANDKKPGRGGLFSLFGAKKQ